MIAVASNCPPRSAASRAIVFWLFRLATYFILACATYIFLDIGIKGGRTVFTTKPPFINLPFLTEPPETLYVFDYEGKKLTLSDRQFRALESRASRRGGRSRRASPIRRAASGPASSARRCSWSDR